MSVRSETRPLFYVISDQKAELWSAALKETLGETAEVVTAPAPVDPAAVDYAVVWAPAPGALAGFSALKAVFNLGAGVDRLLGRPDLPDHIPIIRLQDAGMAPQMLEYALYGVLRHQRDFDLYGADQSARTWAPRLPRLAADVRVTVLGLGAIGGVVATGLAGLGYTVRGWSRSPRSLTGVNCHHGADALMPLLGQTDVLVNVLPSTPETRGLLGERALQALPSGASLINCARGDQVDEVALLAELDRGHLRSALLDVFAIEPLSPDSRLWTHPRVVVTPHVAAATLPEQAAEQIVTAFRALQDGGPGEGRLVPGLVDRSRSY